MRLIDLFKHPVDHAGLINVGIDQHHDQPENIEISNTSLVVSPLPADPKNWDITVPYDTQVVQVALRSNRTIAEGSGKAGVIVIANRSQLQATSFSLGGETSTTITAYNACYSKVASALNLSHRIFSSSGNYIALTNAYLYETVAGVTRVLRLEFTNYGASNYTLNCWGEVQIIG